MQYSKFQSQQMPPLALTRQTQNYNRTKALKLNINKRHLPKQRKGFLRSRFRL
jgi:hypothetical protein